MDKGIRNAIIASVLIISFSIAYYLVYFLPQKEFNRLERERVEQEQKEALVSWEMKKRQECNDKAGESATSLLKEKAEMYPHLKEAAEKGLFLKDDYNVQYENCLSVNGLKK